MHIPGRKNCAPDAMSRGVPHDGEVAALRVDGQTVQGQTEQGVWGSHAHDDHELQPEDNVCGEEDNGCGEEVACSEVRSHMLAMLRTVLDSDIAKPDYEMDVSGELLASMDLGVKSIT